MYSLLERPSLTRYARSLNANSTAGLEGKCDKVFGCAGTICIFVETDDPLVPTKFFLSSRDKSFSLIAASAMSATFFRSAFNLAPRSKSKLYSIAQIDAQQYFFVHSLLARIIFQIFFVSAFYSKRKELKIINKRNQNRCKSEFSYFTDTYLGSAMN